MHPSPTCCTPPSPAPSTRRAAACGADYGPPPAPANRVLASELPLAGTLLATALATGKARFVSDAALYFQQNIRPAPDVFTPASQAASALVVVPVCGGGGGGSSSDDPEVVEGPLGGIYFALDAPSDFAQLQAPILGAVSMTAALLQRKLGGRAAALRAALASGVAYCGGAGTGTGASSVSSLRSAASAGSVGERGVTSRAASCPEAAVGDGGREAEGDAGARAARMLRSKSLSGRRLNTDALMKVGARWRRVGVGCRDRGHVSTCTCGDVDTHACTPRPTRMLHARTRAQ